VSLINSAMVKVVVGVLAKHGLATVLALALVWWLTQDMAGTQRWVKDTLTTHSLQTDFYLRQICVNTATTDAQRGGCLPKAATNTP